MLNRTTITRLVVAAMLALVAFTVSPGAFNPQPDPPGFGMVGITPDQTARLTVSNLGGCSVPGRLIPPDPCKVTVELNFIDGDGNIVAHDISIIPGGQTRQLDLDGARVVPLTDAVGLRGQVRASLNFVSGPTDSLLVPAVQVFDTFGPDAGRSRLSLNANHNATLLRDVD